METQNERKLSEVLAECERLTDGGKKEWRDIQTGLYISKSYDDGYRLSCMGAVFEVWPKCHPSNVRVAHALLGLGSRALLKAAEKVCSAYFDALGGLSADPMYKAILGMAEIVNHTNAGKEAHNG